MSTTHTFTVPDNPADPEAAALDLIVRLPAQVMHTDRFVPVLQDYCGMLHAEGAFTGLAWADAKQVAAAVAVDACTQDNGAEVLRNRARNALSGADNMGWRNREGVARALNIAAMVLGE